MKNILYNTVISGILIWIFLGCNSRQPSDFKEEMQSAVQNLRYNGTVKSVAQLMEELGLQGLSVAVIDDYQIAWTRSWGVKEAGSGAELDENTAFCTASISKPVAATLFAILEAKGLIDLKAPVSTYLKRWKLPESELTTGIEVTFEHLLSHTAGTSQHGHKDLYEGDSIPTVIQSLNGKIPGGNSKLEFLDIPGTWWRYSGGGYVIAQVAIEDHLGSSLEDLAEEHLFSPLKLRHTTFIQPNEPGFFLTNVAKSHNRNGEVIRSGIQISPQLAPSGLWSTPSDLALFMIEIQKALNGAKTKVISKEVALRVTDIITSKVMGGWSMGWERRFGFGNRDWFSHGGSNQGMGGHLYATMEGGKGIAFLANGGNSARLPILNSLRNSIIASHGWTVALDRSKFQHLPEEVAKRAVGNYTNEYGELVPVEYKEGRLYVRDFDFRQRLELFYLGNNTFKVNESKRTVRFDAINPADQKRYLATVTAHGPHTTIDYGLQKISDTLPFQYLLENNYAKALEAYQREKAANPQLGLLRESTLNRTGYQELAKKNHALALSVFKINTVLYPKSANTYDSLGECHMIMGNTEAAIKNYRKVLELDPENPNAKAMIMKLSQ